MRAPALAAERGTLIQPDAKDRDQFIARLGVVTLRSQNENWRPGMHRLDMEIILLSVNILTGYSRAPPVDFPLNRPTLIYTSDRY